MADKKLLEESTIRRFMQLANIKPTESGVLTEGTQAGGRTATTDDGQSSGATPTRGVKGTQTMAEKKKHPKKMEQEDLEENVDEDLEEGYHQEEGLDEAEGEEGGEETPMDLGAGDEMGADSEGGDLESAVEQLVSAMNGVLAAAGMSDKTVELDSGEGEEGSEDMESEPEAGMKDEQPESGRMMEADSVEEDLEESIELVDDTLVEKLLQRVSARLVAEARKSRELAESKNGWGKQGMKKAKKPNGKGAGKGTPFTKPVSVKGTAGRK